MRLVGKRVERLNRYGDDLCIELQESGRMRISPALQSRMNLRPDNNKVGFAYPEEGDTEQVVNIYVAPDGNGVAVNNQGVLSNTPHNRDLRSHYEESSLENVKLFVAEQSTEMDGFPGYRFFKIKSQSMLNTATDDYSKAVNTLEEAPVNMETFVSSQTDEDIIEHATETESSNPAVEEEVFGTDYVTSTKSNIEKNFQEDAIQDMQNQQEEESLDSLDIF